MCCHHNNKQHSPFNQSNDRSALIKKTFSLTCTHPYIYTPQSLRTQGRRAPREAQLLRMTQEWGVVGAARLICRGGSHPDVHQQARARTGRGCFLLYSLLHPSLTARTASMLAAASFLTNYQLSLKTHPLIRNREKKRNLRRFDFPLPSLKADDDTTLGNRHL